jgi:hypothetical protein
MFKLEIENVGSGFQTIGRGEMSTAPQIGLSRKSKLVISAQQFLDYEPDIRYYHTAHCGEIRVRLLVDGEPVSPNDVKELCLASEIAEPSFADTQAASLTPIAPDLAQPGLDAVEEQAPVVAPLQVSFTGARAALE